MITKYKSAAYQFDSNKGMAPDVISSLDEWLNTWLSRGYTIDKMTEITKNGICTGFMFVFKVEK